MAHDGRSCDEHDAAAADCDSKAGAAQYGWKNLGDGGSEKVTTPTPLARVYMGQSSAV
jgi:hypothetical protein